MKRLVSILTMLFFAGTLVFFVACSEKKADVAEGILAPNIDVSDARTGQALDVSHLKGKVVFVNFWASWCPPCKEEMPSIEALYRELMKNDAFVMITILYKDEAKTAMNYMQAFSYTFPLFTDNNGISAKRYGVTGVPETYLIDKKGTLRKRVIGPADWYSAEAKAYINSLLSE